MKRTEKTLQDLFQHKEIRENEREILNKVIKTKTKMNILEIGSGYGKITNYIEEIPSIYKTYTGIDQDKEAIKYCKENYECNTIKFKKANITKKKLRKNTYDLIIMSHIFEHITLKEGNKLLKKIYKALKKNGQLINIMPNPQKYISTLEVKARLAHLQPYIYEDHELILKEIGYKNIKTHNMPISKGIGRIIHKTTLLIFETINLALGYHKQKIYTTSYITTATK